MQTYNPGHVYLSRLSTGVSGLHWDEMSYFRQTIDYNPDRIISRSGSGKSGNEIHAKLIPLPFGNRFLMFLFSLQNSAKEHVLFTLSIVKGIFILFL